MRVAHALAVARGDCFHTRGHQRDRPQTPADRQHLRSHQSHDDAGESQHQLAPKARDRDAKRRLVGDHAENVDPVRLRFPDHAVEHLEATVPVAKLERPRR